MLAAAGSFPRVYLIFTPFIGPCAKSLGQREDGCGGTWLAWLIPFWKGLKGASSRDLNSGNSPFSLLRMPPFASLSVGTRGTAGHLAAPHLSSTSLQLWHPAPPPPVPLHGGQACQWQRQQRWARGRTHPQGPSMLCLFLFPVAEEWAINVMICFPWRKWHLPFPDPAVDVEGEPVQAFFQEGRFLGSHRPLTSFVSRMLLNEAAIFPDDALWETLNFHLCEEAEPWAMEVFTAVKKWSNGGRARLLSLSLIWSASLTWAPTTLSPCDSSRLSLKLPSALWLKVCYPPFKRFFLSLNPSPQIDWLKAMESQSCFQTWWRRK